MDNPYRPYPAEVVGIEQETKTEKTFALAFERGRQIRPGQFFEVSLPGAGEAPFSVSSIGDGFFEMTVRKIGRVSETLHHLKVHDKVWLRGPYGKGFPVDKFNGEELLVIAGGTGTAPVRALIRKIEDGDLAPRRLKILLGFRDRENILFEKDIKRWEKNFSCRLTLDYPDDTWEGLKGFVNQHIDKLKPSPQAYAVAVGPPVMMKFVAEELMEEGLGASRILVSLERLMQCGMGKCGHCRIESTYVCLDGPVFDYARMKDLVD